MDGKSFFEVEGLWGLKLLPLNLLDRVGEARV